MTCCRLLGEPCDPEILIQHYGKLGATVHSEAGMDLKSESAAIYVMVSRLKGKGREGSIQFTSVA